jgi:hypothetical protein
VKSEALLALLKRLKLRNVPISGVGLQLHGIGSVKTPFFSSSSSELADYMKAITQLGLRVEITEMDISLPAVINDFGVLGMSDQQHLQLQADLYLRAAKACAQVINCSGITVWGLRDKDSWINNFVPGGPHRPLLLDDGGTPKPSYEAVRSGILERCPNASAKLCSEPWPNPLDIGAPWPKLKCKSCVKPTLAQSTLRINPSQWNWQRPVDSYAFRWMQSRRGRNQGYRTIPLPPNRTFFKSGSSQYRRWVKVCVRAINSYGSSEWMCSASRGPFRKR